MKRFNVVVLLVVAMVLFATGSAFAERLKLASGSPEPTASGTVSFKYQGPYGYYDQTYWRVDVHVKCQGLTPNATYWLWVGGWLSAVSCQTDGAGQLETWTRTYPSSKKVKIYVELDNSNGVAVLVNF